MLPGAVFTFQQLASNREWKLSGSPSGVARANEWLHGAVSRQYDGLEFVGFDHFLRLRSLDYLTVGRRMFYAPRDGDLEYLDPVYTNFNLNDRVWIDNLTGRKLPQYDVYVDHTLPLGGSGRFTSPLMMVIPSAVLAWLIREHDSASLDGRKVREVIIVKDEDMQTSIGTAIAAMMKLYSDPSQTITSNNIPIAVAEGEYDGPIQDLIGRLGITQIPDGFDRKSFIFQFVNEVSAATGLSLRHFWNQEQSTNRALEEVQQQRQAQKGPETFVRSEQRVLNHPRHKILRRFGPRTRMAFYEEVDAQSQLVSSQALKNSADAFKILNEAASADGKKIALESLIAWMQMEGHLPNELDIKVEEVVEVSDPNTDPNNQMSSDPQPSRMSSGNGLKSAPARQAAQTQPSEKDFDLDYGEVTINSKGEIIDRRLKLYPLEKALVDEMAKDEEIVKELFEEEAPFDFSKALRTAREAQHAEFLKKASVELGGELAKYQTFENLTDTDFLYIDYFMSSHES